MYELLSSFVAELRVIGLPVSLSEHVDAARAIESVDISDRDLFRASLSATLVKDGTHLGAFDTAFDVFFAARRPGHDPDAAGEVDVDASASGAPATSAAESAEELFDALARDDPAAMKAAAHEAVERYAGFQPGRPVGGAYYLYRTMRHLDLEGLEERLSALGVAGAPESSGELFERLARDEAQRRIESFREMVSEEIRERLIADRGAEAVAASVRETLPEDVDVMHANRLELEELERALAPLSRKLAARLARKRRRHRRGPLDMRHTMRASLSTGGVPIDVRYRPPRPVKPELVVFADVSGSVASFARFTLHLVHAISEEFSKVRSFVFVDGVDEVTDFFHATDDPAEAAARIASEADVVAFDGHSDYGRALMSFSDLVVNSLTRRTTILILGDARNNYHVAHPEVLAQLQSRVKAIYWLNPEPRAYWNSGDSVIGLYGAYCNEVLECRTLRQLEEFVSALA